LSENAKTRRACSALVAFLEDRLAVFPRLQIPV
jgi:hypothetical protein